MPGVKLKPNPSFERTRTGMPLQAPQKFVAFGVLQVAQALLAEAQVIQQLGSQRQPSVWPQLKP